MAIKIIITGGTFDKEYNEITGELFFNKTHLPEMLKLGRSRLNVKMVNLMMRDSLHMNDSDLKIILDECKKSDENKILITHGTDKMVKTSVFLAKYVKNRTIVITGAMVPYAFGSSDGLFNLGSALAFVQTLPHGIYISMNGRIFPWDNVRKDKENGEFVNSKFMV